LGKPGTNLFMIQIWITNRIMNLPKIIQMIHCGDLVPVLAAWFVGSAAVVCA
jgi:hypothetical protein